MMVHLSSAKRWIDLKSFIRHKKLGPEKFFLGLGLVCEASVKRGIKVDLALCPNSELASRLEIRGLALLHNHESPQYTKRWLAKEFIYANRFSANWKC